MMMNSRKRGDHKTGSEEGLGSGKLSTSRGCHGETPPSLPNGKDWTIERNPCISHVKFTRASTEGEAMRRQALPTGFAVKRDQESDKSGSATLSSALKHLQEIVMGMIRDNPCRCSVSSRSLYKR
ncbi:hypothetical protein PoB_006139000 [Plakobranchus ocellatus]|uniref:Uncharacterized protein n=1 Tax=Plakobranchus ocellatus TaxID=259542 RepID=A0AAV4CSQ1_9GAST|nr:hypothetical protein PoB_006139000 [Plakobranchus ocellatus]